MDFTSAGRRSIATTVVEFVKYTAQEIDVMELPRDDYTCVLFVVHTSSFALRPEKEKTFDQSYMDCIPQGTAYAQNPLSF